MPCPEWEGYLVLSLWPMPKRQRQRHIMAATLTLNIRFRKALPKMGCPLCIGERISGAQAALDTSTQYLTDRGWPNVRGRARKSQGEIMRRLVVNMTSTGPLHEIVHIDYAAPGVRSIGYTHCGQSYFRANRLAHRERDGEVTCKSCLRGMR